MANFLKNYKSPKSTIACEVFQKTNKMSFNMKKSQIMMVKKRGKTEKSNTTLNGQPMSECDQYCYLGDNIDGRNSPKANLEKLQTKANLCYHCSYRPAKQGNSDSP